MSEKAYLDYLQLVLEQGELIPNRTGIAAYTYPHHMLRFDMSKGFPLLTTKKMAWNSVKVELEFFIKGLSSKKWLQDRGCNIWNEWANPVKIPNELSKEQKITAQIEEDDLGKIYGVQWRNFNSQRKDQLSNIVYELKNNPSNRQLVCSAWNPCELHEMALPPCHLAWHVFVTNRRLHLSWYQRSVDSFLGLPFNIASYGLLLHLLAKECNLQQGILTGFLSNCHIYENHVEAVKTQLNREIFSPPVIITQPFKNIFDWEYKDTYIEDYRCGDAIKANIAI